MQDNAIAPAPAPFLVRIAAMVYESLLVTAVVFVAALPFLYLVGTAERGWLRHVFQLYLLAILFAYFSAFWLRSGQTLAMKTWRIRLVNADGGPLTFRQALLRFLLALLGLLLAGAGFWWALFDRDRQFLHDRIAGTRLIRVPRKAEP
ncbi:MAG TPA: RDD family protein [Thiobacillus sp.]|nr:RDD family protein [Thiobacillus sp.]